MILETFASGPLETNTYLLGCLRTKQASVIDAPLGMMKRLVCFLDKHQLVLSKILLTHSHLDHIGDAALLKETFQAPLFIHQKDSENLERPGSDGIPLFFPVKAARPDRFLVEGDEIEVGDLTLRVIETPGHTPGGVCFYLPSHSMLFSGDTLFQGSMGRIDFPHSSPSSMWKSLKKLSLLPSQTRVFPGHGPATSIAAESWINDPEKRFG